MRRLLPVILILILGFLHIPPAALADSPFSLVSGRLDHPDSNSPAMVVLWQGIRIDITDTGGDMLPFHAEHTVALDRDANNTSYTGAATVDGLYHLTTGELTGSYQVTVVSESSLTNVKGRKPYQNRFTSVYTGYITGKILPGDTSVKLNFTGDWDQKAEGTLPNAQPVDENMTFASRWGFDVTFAIEGDVPLLDEKSAIAMDDSGVKFVDLAPDVEVLIPLSSAGGVAVYDRRNWFKATPGMTLPALTIIRVSGNQHQILQLPDGSTMDLRPGSVVKIYAEQGKNRHDLEQGRIKVTVKKTIDFSLEIDMDQTVVLVKGTTFVVEKDGDNSKLRVIEGTVEFQHKKSEESVTVSAGEMVSASQAGLNEKQSFDVEQEMAQWDPLPAQKPSGLPAWLAPGVVVACLAGLCLAALLVLVLILLIWRRKKPARHFK